MRVTIACPELLITKANELAKALGTTEFDGETFGIPLWEDSLGNKYAVASGAVSPVFVTNAFSALQDKIYPYDKALAEEVQALIALDSLATPTSVAAVINEDTDYAMSVLGLERIQDEG